MVGQLLTEQWRHVAAGLEPAMARSIDQYLNTPKASKEHYQDTLKLFPIWLVSRLSTHNIPLQSGLFDYLVIDAASQYDIPSVLPLLFRGKRIIVIGDEHQPGNMAALADTVSQQLAERHNIAIKTAKSHSLFDLAVNSVSGGPGHVRLNTAQTPD